TVNTLFRQRHDIVRTYEGSQSPRSARERNYSTMKISYNMSSCVETYFDPPISSVTLAPTRTSKDPLTAG
ncbi:hypothetical protein BGW80DRAFT_1357658, partial [Lactifluus volemus]